MDNEGNKCPKCSYKIFPGEVFCRKCGNYCPKETKTTNTSSEPEMSSENKKLQGYIDSTINRNEQVTEKPITPNSPNQKIENKPIDFNAIYIGKNSDKLMTGDFSACMFFLGTFYLFYRKMWLLAFTCTIISAITAFFIPIYGAYISFIISILLCFKFKSIYRSHVNKKVMKIREKNSDKTDDEIARICKKKGGTNIFLAIAFPSIIFLLVFFLVFLYGTLQMFKNILKDDNKQDDNTVVPIKEEKLFDLYYDVPKNFIMNNSVSNKNTYIILSPTDNCEFSVEVDDNAQYTSAEETLDILYPSEVENNKDYVTVYDEIWRTLKIESTISTNYYYALIKNNNLYIMEFKIKNNSNNECSVAYDTLRKSLRFTE